MTAQDTPARNYVRLRGGVSSSAICQCCGKRSRPVDSDSDGEPKSWHLAAGWSTAPFPPGFKHADGSIGSCFTCPACNKRLHAGETLQVRAYMGGTRRTRLVREDA